MRILVITSEKRWSDSVRALFDNEHDVLSWTYAELETNANLLKAIGATFVAEGVVSADTVQSIRRILKHTEVPVFVLCDRAPAEWEEAAVVAGAVQVFTFPLRAKLIQASCERVLRRTPGPSVNPLPPAVTVPAFTNGNGEVLGLLREFSRLLVHALDGPLFMREYFRSLREVLRCSRLVLYLADASTADKWLRCVVAEGVNERALDSIRLSPDDGLAKLLTQRGAVVLACRLKESIPLEAVASREFEVLGAELAVPLNTKGGLVGALLLGPRIAGSDYTDNELTLLYHLMEEFGASVKNASLHADLVLERSMFSSVLRAVPVGCLVLTQGLRVAHANAAIRRYLGLGEQGDLNFEDLPPNWATAAYSVLHGKRSEVAAELAHETFGKRGVFNVTVRMLDDFKGKSERSVLLVAEDITGILEARATNEAMIVRTLLQRAGEQLANEFRNALTPLGTMIQLAGTGPASSPGTEGLNNVVFGAMHRIMRRVDDLAYLTRSSLIPESTPLRCVVDAARRRFEQWVEPSTAQRVQWPAKVAELEVVIDSKAVALSLAELLMNGVEASVADPVCMEVEILPDTVCFRFTNRGEVPIRTEAKVGVRRPFVSDKAAGVGIGLEVASRVAENHGGSVTLLPGSPGQVEASLRVARHLDLTNFKET